MENPIGFMSDEGMRKFGELLRKWAKDESQLPSTAVKNGRTIRIERDDLVTFLTSGDVGMIEGQDFEIRDGVTRVELICRDETVATLLLPERGVIERLESGEITTIAMPTFYATSGIEANAPGALYDLPLAEGEAKFAEFIDRHLGFYSCSQCA